MNAKQRADGSPNVVYLEGLLREKFGAGFRVVLPITDPYVLHHGALGSFAVVHAPAGADLRRVAEVLLLTDGITEVMDRATAAKKLELPADRLGELVVISGRDVVLGFCSARR
jgi:phosphonoacetate hydrolase